MSLLNSFFTLPLPILLLLALWVVVMISLPIVKWIWGARAEKVGISAGVVAQAAAVLALLLWNDFHTVTFLAALAVVLLGFTVEYVGSHTGIPFGRYHYTDVLRPQIGHVPVIIPLAWLMMMPPSWAVAALLVGPEPRWLFAVTAGAAFTAWDLFLDPQMVHWNFWQWEKKGRYFGIPAGNFFGWFAAATLITALVAPTSLPLAGLVVVYALTWLLETIAQLFFWQLPGPAVGGFLVMGIFVVSVARTLF